MLNNKLSCKVLPNLFEHFPNHSPILKDISTHY